MAFAKAYCPQGIAIPFAPQRKSGASSPTLFRVRIQNNNATKNFTSVHIRVDARQTPYAVQPIDVIDSYGNKVPFLLENRDQKHPTDFGTWNQFVFWVIVDLPAGGQTELRVLASQGTPSTPEDFFLFYDDFEVLDTTKWVVSGTPTVGTSVITFSSTGAVYIVASPSYAFGGDLVFEAYAKHSSGRPVIKLYNNINNQVEYAGFDNYVSGTPNSASVETYVWQACSAFNGAFSADNLFHVFKIDYSSQNYVKGYVDENLVGTVNTCFPTQPLRVNLGVVGGSLSVDWIRLYKLVDPPPTVQIIL